MRRKSRKVTYTGIAVITAMLILIGMISGGAVKAHAAETASAAYEARNIMDDLKGATIDGEPLDLSQYTLDSHKNVQMISFVEFCYSPFEEKQADFGLYVYVYNPRGLDWTKIESLNSIQFKYYNFYEKFSLKYLNRSEEPGKEGLFYKFKVKLADPVRQAILGLVNSNERVYEVSGIELYDSGTNPTEYKIANTYTYTGYAEGCGSDSADKSSLSCTVKQAEVVELNNVKSTYYMYATTTQTATQLNTVYFAIDNDYRNRYGKVYSISAEYNRYNLAPIVVVNDDNVYNALTEHYCDIETEDKKTSYILHAYSGSWPGVGLEGGINYNSDWGYGRGVTIDIFGVNINKQYPYTDYTKPLLVFKSGDTTPGKRLVTREELLQRMDELTREHGNGTAYGGYNDYLFDGKGTHVPVKLNSDELFELKGFNASNSLKDWWWNIWHDTNQTITDISPVYEVQREDLLSDNISDKLLIAKEDVAEFRAYCTENMKKDKTVVMFRYSTSEYKEQSAIAIPTGVTWGFAEKDGQSVRWQTVDLGFDIISLGLKNDKEIETVLPVVMSPITVIASSSGMKDILDGELSDWWKYAIGISGVLIGIIIVTRVVKGAKEKLK